MLKKYFSTKLEPYQYTWTKTGLTLGAGCHVAHTSRLALLAVTYIPLGAASTAGSVRGVLALHPRETRQGVAATCLSLEWIRAWSTWYRHNETVKTLFTVLYLRRRSKCMAVSELKETHLCLCKFVSYMNPKSYDHLKQNSNFKLRTITLY